MPRARPGRPSSHVGQGTSTPPRSTNPSTLSPRTMWSCANFCDSFARAGLTRAQTLAPLPLTRFYHCPCLPHSLRSELGMCVRSCRSFHQLHPPQPHCAVRANITHLPPNLTMSSRAQPLCHCLRCSLCALPHTPHRAAPNYMQFDPSTPTTTCKEVVDQSCLPHVWRGRLCDA
jgi:hypothetical protein